MPKLRVLSGRQVRAILESNGFFHSHNTGSHMIMKLRSAGGSSTVPVPDHKELTVGTLGSIIRLSGLSRALFEV